VRPENDEEVLKALDEQAQGYGNTSKFAVKIGTVTSHISDVRSGYRKMDKRIAAALGYELKWVKKQG
jgi:hypothetical protein